MSFPATAGEPPNQRKGFAKIRSIPDVAGAHAFHPRPRRLRAIRVGTSSRDLPLEATVGVR